MGAPFKSSTYGVPGWKTQKIQGENKSFTAWQNSVEQATSSSQNNEGQESQAERGAGRGITGKNLESVEVRKESPDKCRDCIRIKKGTIPNINVGNLSGLSVQRPASCGGNTPDAVVIVDDDTDSGVSTCNITSSTEQEDDNMSTEMNSGHVISDAKQGSDDVDTESDYSSSENRRLFYRQTAGQSPNSSLPVSFSLYSSDNEDDCQVFEPCIHFCFNSKNTKNRQKQCSSGCYRYLSDSDSDSPECEILEGSYGEIRQKWEEAALRKRVPKGFHNTQHEGGVETSGFGSKLATDSPIKEEASKVTTNWNDADFGSCNARGSSRHPSDFACEIGMKESSYGMNVHGFRTSKELDSGNPSYSRVNLSDKVVPCKDTIDINSCSEEKKLDKSKNRETSTVNSLKNAECLSQEEENHNHMVSYTTEGPKKGSSMNENLTEWINNREKLKETAEFQFANQEEWAHRRLELQRQAEEAQRLRRKRKAEAERLLQMERRQKQRIEEMWVTKRKEEQKMDLKEQLREQVRSRLEEMASRCKDMASLLRCLGIPVEGGFFPSSQQVNAAYKKALLRFHPDRASVSKGGLHHQVEAEETFKMISCRKNTFSLVATNHGSQTYW